MDFVKSGRIVGTPWFTAFLHTLGLRRYSQTLRVGKMIHTVTEYFDRRHLVAILSSRNA
jgi:hypothetical protein